MGWAALGLAWSLITTHQVIAQRRPIDRPFKTSDSPWIDTTDGIHLFSLWGRGADGPQHGWGTGRRSRCEYVWGCDTPAALDAWHATDASTVVSHYIPYARDPNASHTTAWWQEHHPDFILYKCDRKTVARSFGDRNMQLDFSNPEVIQWQLNGPDNSFSVQRISLLGYDAIAADNFGFGNGWGACGVFRKGKWVQLYNATDAGKKAFAEAYCDRYAGSKWHPREVYVQKVDVCAKIKRLRRLVTG